MHIPRAAALAALVLSSVATAQVAPLSSRTVPVQIRSGQHDNPWNAGHVVASRMVTQPGAPWMRLHFGDVNLPGSSHLEIVSVDDGAIQHLDAEGLEHWSRTSAYFNGDAVYVRLIAGPTTHGASFDIREIVVGGPLPLRPTTLCGGESRIRSNDPRVARLMSVGCTAWLIDATNSFASAGHCCGSSATVVQFNVPLSSSGGSVRHPGPKDQYPVNSGSKRSNNGGIGNDWCVFRTNINSTTGLHAGEAQQDFFNFPWLRPSVGTTIRITGHGTTSPRNQLNQVQKTHTGPLRTSSTQLCYRTDTTGGNSGSPVIDDTTGLAVGVHTHGGCTSSGSGCNSGTSITLNAFRSAVLNIVQRRPGGISTFGTGCPGSNGQIPTLAVSGTTNLGGQVTVTLTGAQPNAPVRLYQGMNNRRFGDFDLPACVPGIPACACQMYTSLDSAVDLMTDGQGNATYVLAIPRDPTLNGRAIYFQWRALDAGANPTGFTWSNAGQVIVFAAG